MDRKKKVGVADAGFHSARHSVYRDKGETDVLLVLTSPEGHVAVMIEDKIGAQMQPQQCERYHQRGQALCEGGDVLRYTTVLCAPQSYLSAVALSEPWDHRISHEEIAEWLQTDLSPSSGWRRAILLASTSKSTRARYADGKSNVPVDGVLAAMKAEYREFLLQNYPNLTASVQTGQDREYYIGARGIHKGIRFKHAFFRGEVSLVLERSRADQNRDRLPDHLPEGAWINDHGGELHVRMATEVMDPALPVGEQTDAVKQALDAISQLVLLANELA